MAVEMRNIKFVQEVRKYPCLYNCKLADYMRKDTTETAWTEVGKRFKISGPAAKEKWKNLRSVFVRHLRSDKNGAVRKKPYYLDEYMQFAVPFIKKPAVISESYRDSSRGLSVDDDSRELPTPEPQTSTPSQPSSSQRKPNNNETQGDGDISSYYKSADSGGSAENCSKMFLLSLLSDMNQMNDGQRRLFKRQVLGLVASIMDDHSTTTPVGHAAKRTRLDCKEEREEAFDVESNSSDPLLL